MFWVQKARVNAKHLCKLHIIRLCRPICSTCRMGLANDTYYYTSTKAFSGCLFRCMRHHTIPQLTLSNGLVYTCLVSKIYEIHGRNADLLSTRLYIYCCFTPFPLSILSHPYIIYPPIPHLFNIQTTTPDYQLLL